MIDDVVAWFMADPWNRGAGAFAGLMGVCMTLSYLTGLWVRSGGYCGAMNRGGSRCRNYVGDGARCRVRHAQSWPVTDLIANCILLGLGAWLIAVRPIPPDWADRVLAFLNSHR